MPLDLRRVLEGGLRAQGITVDSALKDSRVRTAYGGLVLRGRYLQSLGKSRSEVIVGLRADSTIVVIKRPHTLHRKLVGLVFTRWSHANLVDALLGHGSLLLPWPILVWRRKPNGPTTSYPSPIAFTASSSLVRSWAWRILAKVRCDSHSHRTGRGRPKGHNPGMRDAGAMGGGRHAVSLSLGH